MEFLKIFLKGALMGISDIIPGISGGTIAFILGIYERLINAIKSINVNFLFSNRKDNWKRMDLKFLIPLSLGIGIAFLVSSRIIPYLLDWYPAYIFSFFFGLILGSIYLIRKRIRVFRFSYIIIVIITFIFAFLIASIEGISANHSYWFIFVSGIVAIIAMLLPGISGSYILLLLGQYKFMLEALREIKIYYIISFILGAVIGLLAASRIISYLLKRYHNATISALVGLMLGSLKTPFVNIAYVKLLYPQIGFIWDITSILVVGALFLLGIIVVILIGRFDSSMTK